MAATVIRRAENCQLSIINCQFPSAFRLLIAATVILRAENCQLSIINCQFPSAFRLLIAAHGPRTEAQGHQCQRPQMGQQVDRRRAL